MPLSQIFEPGQGHCALLRQKKSGVLQVAEACWAPDLELGVRFRLYFP
jgi:hypothetical protein